MSKFPPGVDACVRKGTFVPLAFVHAECHTRPHLSAAENAGFARAAFRAAEQRCARSARGAIEMGATTPIERTQAGLEPRRVTPKAHWPYRGRDFKEQSHVN